MSKKTPAAPKLQVSEMLSLWIEASGKNQAQIAEEVGFNRPNIITMLKQGKTKVPIDRIGPMARSLGVDPLMFFKVVMQEYQPDTWEAIESLTSQPLLTANELKIIRSLREADAVKSAAIPDSDIPALTRAIQAHLGT